MAVALGFVSFSLLAATFIAGQTALGWETTLLATAWDGPIGGRVLHLVTLALANLGSAAAFGLAVYAVARALDTWRGRLPVLWALTLGGLAIAGAVAWLLDGSLPRW